MKEWLDFQRRRIVCFLKDHEAACVVNWQPDSICMQIVCSRCGKGIGHVHLPTAKNAPKTEKLH